MLRIFSASLRLCLALGLWGLLAAPSRLAAQTTTYRDVDLDAGGWVSGFAQHASGRLYGFGDIFGLYRSDDFGAHWKFIQGSLTENATFVVGVTVSPFDANRVAFNGYASAWTSLDGGETWTKRLGDLSGIKNVRGTRPIAYHPAQANELWLAATRSGQSGSLWRTTDNGLSWSAVGGAAFVNERATTVHFFSSAPNEVWVGTAAVSGLSTTGGLWCSADGGATWTKVWNNGGAQTQYYGAPQVNSIARNSARVSVFATNTGVWQVTATNWNDPQTYVATSRTFANQSIPNVTALADGTFWTSEIGDQPWAPKTSADGVTWNDRQITLTTAYVPEWSTAAQISAFNRVYGRDILVQDVSNSNRWLLTGGASAHLSVDNGLSWRYQPGDMAGTAGWRTNFDRVNPGRTYLSTSDRGIFVVSDGGLSGQTTQCSRHTFDELHTFHETLVSADGQTLVGAGVDQGANQTVIIRSTDGGASWSKLNPSGLPLNYEGITRATMSLNDPNDFLVLLGCTDKPGQANNPGLYRTINGGATFSKVGGTTFDGVDTGMRYHDEYAYLERDGINAGTRYLYLRAANNSFVRGVWRSLDGGTTWTQRTNPFGGAAAPAFAVDAATEGRLWAGGSALSCSNDGGGAWSNVANFVQVLAVDAFAGRIGVIGRRSGDTFQKVYSSLDNGTSWQEVTNAQNRLIWTKGISVDRWRPGQLWLTGSRSFQVINPPDSLDPALVGTISGGAPSAGNPAFGADKAFDGDTSTAFVPAAAGGFAQLDLGSGQSARVTSVRFFPRAGFEGSMNGGRFEGSTDGVSWTTLYSLSATPAVGWQTASVSATGFFRYLRYLHPTAQADVAEVELHGIVATAPTILNQPLPTLSGYVGQALTYSISASGAPAPTFTITSGVLPAGLVLNATSGVISGTPTAVGAGTVTIKATNSKGSASASFTLNVPSGPRLAVTTPSPSYTQPTRTVGMAPVVITNTGDAPLSWAASVPSIDNVYTLASSTTAGSGVTYEWIDAINGGTKLGFGSDDDANTGPVPLPFTFPFGGIDRTSLRVCTNGWLSFTSTLTSYVAPAGLPDTGSSTPENLIAPFYTDLYLRSDSGIYHRTVDAQTFVVSYVDLVRYEDRALSNPSRYSFQVVLKSDGRIFFAYQKVPNLSPTNGRVIGLQNSSRTIGTPIAQPSPISLLVERACQLTPPLGWLAAITPSSSSAAGGTLAGGASLTLNATINTNGIATGQSRAGTLTFTSNDQVNPSRAVTFNLSVGTPNAPPTITAGQIVTGVVGTPFSYTLLASNAPTGWTLVSGSLPSGITLNASTGVLAGTPTATGAFTPTFTANNAGGVSAAQSVSITINTAPTGTSYGFNTSQANFEAALNETTGWGALWNATAGVGASGGLATDSSDRAALLPDSTLTFNTAGQSVELSVAFKARVTAGTTNTAGGESLRLGLNRANTPLLAAGAYLVAGLNEASANALTSALAAESRNNVAGTTVSTTDTTALTLTDNDWYALDATITYNGSGAFTVTCALYGLGAGGSATPALLDTYTATRTGLDSLVGVPVYAGFQGKTNAGFGGVRAFDDFYAGLPAPPPTGLQFFRTTAGLAGDGSQDLLSPAGDGVANLLKYAFNMIGSDAGQAASLATPNASVLSASGSAGLPFVGIEAATGKLQITYLRRKVSAHPGITCVVEFSDDLGASSAWASNPAATEVSTSVDTTLERVTVTDSGAVSSRRFVRVRITAP